MSMKRFFRPLFLAAITVLANFGLLTPSRAATITWSGASGTDTNWSNTANWTGGLPGTADDVKFFNTGAVASVSNINNVVDNATTTRLAGRRSAEWVLGARRGVG